jgi:hypothetical protein
MRDLRLPIITALGVGTILVAGASADSDVPVPAPHFRLLEPISWLVENERGDPQKTGPCGGTNTDWGKPSNVVNEATGGQMLHIKLEETVYHPGHYRVALAATPHELPPDPKATTRPDSVRGPMSVSAEIQNPPVAPVLADGLFQHNTRPAAGTRNTFETDVRLPNINCEHCVLQVVQFMEEHAFNNPGGFSYHHCAIMKITADESKPLDTEWLAQASKVGAP